MIPDVPNPAEQEPNPADKMVDAIFERHGNEVDVADLSEEERNVFLPYQTMGIVGNGGFNYLFEGNFPGDPYFALTAAAFETIGSTAAAEAFCKALALFPDSRPPKDMERRLGIYRSGSAEHRHAIDCQFWQANKEICNCLNSYIETQCEAFRRLADPPPQRPPKRNDSPMQPPQSQWSDELPHWARVAFAARCARLLLPLLEPYWPNMPAKNLQMLKSAIELAEQSAAEGRPQPGLQDAKMHATMTAGHALLGIYGSPLEDNSGVPTDGNAGALAASIAKTAEMAVEAAMSSCQESTSPLRSAYCYATEVAREAKAKAILATIERDRTALLRVVVRGNWTDETKVPPLVFDPPSAVAKKVPRGKPWWKFW